MATFNPIDNKRGLVNISLRNRKNLMSFLTFCRQRGGIAIWVPQKSAKNIQFLKVLGQRVWYRVVRSNASYDDPPPAYVFRSQLGSIDVEPLQAT